MQTRRVVSGQDASGKSKIMSDELVSGVAMAGGILTEIWGSDTMPVLPNSGERPSYDGFFAPAGGYRVLHNTILPDDTDVVEDESAQAQLGGGIAEVLEDGENAGMHKTDSADFIIVTAGVVGLELDDGEKVVLNTGDLFVQNGTRHRWFSPNNQPATFLAVMIGGVRS